MGLIPLDSDRWTQLQDAYGPATEDPGLLRQLYEQVEENTWSEIYGRLVHQGSVSNSAYAAVPHVVAVARTLPRDRRLEYLIFAAAVAHGYDRKPIPEDLKAEFDAAIEATRAMAFEILETEAVSEACLPYLFESLAATCGLPLLARILERFSNEEFDFTCRHCSTPLYVSTSNVPFLVYATDPVSDRSAHGIPLAPPSAIPTPSSSIPARGEDALPWLLWLSRYQAAESAFRQKLVYLYGGGNCPRCSSYFNLFSELEREEPPGS